MIFGAVGFVVCILWRGEPLPTPTTEAWIAWGYLVVFGSVIAFTSYMNTLRRLPYRVVVTYAYANPVIAVLLGWLILEHGVDKLWAVQRSLDFEEAYGADIDELDALIGDVRGKGLFVGAELVKDRQTKEPVEEAVLMEFDRITERGGVLGAMETGYQRSKIQEESMYYEMLKHTGRLPIIGVNTFRDPDADDEHLSESIELARATEGEKQSQLNRLADFKKRHVQKAPAALERLQNAALAGGNIFAELMETVRVCSLGQITQALYDVGGKYRRNM